MAPPLDYLIVETGAGVDLANTWIDVVYADAYHLERNRADWASATDLVKVAAILLAGQWIVGQYRFRGSQTDRDRLPFPATAAYDDGEPPRLISGVPLEIKRAQAELAYDHGVRLNAVDVPLDRDLAELKAGPVTLKWAEGGPRDVTRRLVEAELSGLIVSGGLSLDLPLAAGFY